MDPRPDAGDAATAPARCPQRVSHHQRPPPGRNARADPGRLPADRDGRPRVRPGRVTAEPARVILDCDPGIDDALAIVFGCGHPGIDLAGLTTVSGNVNLDTVTGNALSVLELAGRPDVPVVA